GGFDRRRSVRRGRTLDRPLLLRGGCSGGRAARGGLPGRVGLLGHAPGGRQVDARPLACQPGSAHGRWGEARSHRQSAALYRLSPRPALLLSSRARGRPAGHRGRAPVLESPPLMLDIRANLGRVQEAVVRACGRAGRSPDHVLLIAVSKTMDAERVRLAVEAGVAALGENRVQEAKEKIELLGHPVPWHLIGSLQSNKARDAARLFDWIHSLDRLELAQELSRRV